MLEGLTVSGLGIIDAVDIELAPGFVALTGETSAGKSLPTARGVSMRALTRSVWRRAVLPLPRRTTTSAPLWRAVTAESTAAAMVTACRQRVGRSARSARAMLPVAHHTGRNVTYL